MRVLFWSPSFRPAIGGAEVLASRLLPALRARGHQFVVVADMHPDAAAGEGEYDGIRIFRAPFLQALGERNLDRIFWLQRMLAALRRDFKPDLVHNYFLGPSTLFLQATARVHAAPSLVTLHLDLAASEHHLSVESETLGRSTLLAAEWVVACSAALLGDARRLLPEIVPSSSAIPNALDWPALAPEPLTFDPPRLLCLGRLARQKGFDLAVEALPELADRFPGVRLIVAGDGDQGAALRAQAAALGVAELVDFLGWVGPGEVPALINTCTMLLMPSRFEGLPLVAVQAAQMARPVVATPVHGLAEVVVDGETGLLVEPEDARALARAVASLLDRRDVANRMGAAARQRAQDVFGWERHVGAYDSLYHKLVEARRVCVERTEDG